MIYISPSIDNLVIFIEFLALFNKHFFFSLLSIIVDHTKDELPWWNHLFFCTIVVVVVVFILIIGFGVRRRFDSLLRVANPFVGGVTVSDIDSRRKKVGKPKNKKTQQRESPPTASLRPSPLITLYLSVPYHFSNRLVEWTARAKSEGGTLPAVRKLTMPKKKPPKDAKKKKKAWAVSRVTRLVCGMCPFKTRMWLYKDYSTLYETMYL